MSLISDALKKAQRQRTLEAAEGVSGGGGRGRGGAWSGSQKLALAAAALVAVIAVAVAVTITLIQPDADEIAARINAAKTPTVPASEDEVEVAPSVITLPPLPRSNAADAAGTVQSEAASAPPAATPAESEPAAVESSPEPASAPAPSVVVQQFVDDMEIRAVSLRSVAAENRAMIGSRVYGINDIVDRALGLKLVEITEDSLTFSDSNGTLYRRSH